MIEDFKPDYVISTHFMPPEILLRFKEKKKLNFDISVVVTDFDLYYLWLYNNINQYFVGGELAKNKLIQFGIDEKNITISGIQIIPQFFNSFDKQKLLEKWDLDSSKKTLLLMAGGAGIGSLDGIANEVHELMFLSDLVVTKPGDLSTSECITLKKPMLLINPIPGQEEFNAQNIEERKLGKLSTNIIDDIKYMLNNIEDFNVQYKKELTHNTQDIILSHFKEKS